MITIYDGTGHFIRYDSMTFSGGEEHVRLKTPHGTGPIRIEARLWSGREVMQLLMVTDALRRRGFEDIDLVMPYVPYARQDRVCNPGEALSIKVFCDLINSQKYRSVEVWDPHSDVTPALLDRCKVVQQHYFANKIPRVDKMVLVAPDGGALKKIYSLQNLTNQPVIVGQKHRNPENGEITGVSVSNAGTHGWRIRYRDLLIVDDICDGGRTFIEVAKALREAYFNMPYGQTSYAKINLYVTHGIFSKGLDVLRPYIDHVYTANIWPDRYQGNEDYVTVIRKD